MSFELNVWFSSRFRKTRKLNGRFGLGFTKLLERTELNRTFTTLRVTSPHLGSGTSTHMHTSMTSFQLQIWPRNGSWEGLVCIAMGWTMQAKSTRLSFRPHTNGT